MILHFSTSRALGPVSTLLPSCKGARNCFQAKIPCNPLKRLDSDERIQGNPSFSNPKKRRFSRQTASTQENPNRPAGAGAALRHLLPAELVQNLPPSPRAPSAAPPSIRPYSRPSSARRRTQCIGPLANRNRTRPDWDRAPGVSSPRGRSILRPRRETRSRVRRGRLGGPSSRPLVAGGDGAQIPCCWGRWNKQVFAAVRLPDSMNWGRVIKRASRHRDDDPIPLS
jgi:hypothetical protein